MRLQALNIMQVVPITISGYAVLVTSLLYNNVISARDNIYYLRVSSLLCVIWPSMQSNISAVMSVTVTIYNSCMSLVLEFMWHSIRSDISGSTSCYRNFGRLNLYLVFLLAQQPLVGQGLLIVEDSRSYSDTSHTEWILWTSDQPDTETCTWQHTTFKRHTHPCPRRNSNPQSKQTSGHRNTTYTARPLGSTTFHFVVILKCEK
jgi:hypothetical protein